MAVLYALQNVPPFAPLHIISDSKYMINGLTKHLVNWEKRGWIGIDNKDLLQPIAARLRERGAISTFKWTKGHSGKIGNEAADALACEGANKPDSDIIDMSVNPKFNLTGAQLSCMSQALIYQGIKELESVPPQISTEINLDITRHAVHSTSGHFPTDAAIWHSVRHKEIDCTIRIFLWKLLHGVHKCGEYWLNIPGFEQWSTCQTCGVPESMEHILTDCDVPGQKIVWSLAKNLWLKKHKHWPNVTNIGNITGCSLIEVRNQHGQRRNGAERLFRIVITESAYLIWKIRCHRVIEH